MYAPPPAHSHERVITGTHVGHDYQTSESDETGVPAMAGTPVSGVFAGTEPHTGRVIRPTSRYRLLLTRESSGAAPPEGG